ncbi:MAG: hypothetical protein LBK75_00245 [Oscillospiraceae bacterium]|nr:hypothetical protein [Oscillospiraceae bacterium]
MNQSEMTLYEMIFARRSVRQYRNEAFDTSALAEIENHANSAKQLPAQSARFEIVDSSRIKGGVAPYAILAFAGADDLSLVNIGYTLQGVDLWLQANGHGSVWCGMATPKEQRSDYRILIGFGKTDVPLRKSESEFKRKKIADISNADNPVSRAARLAPSAVNFQPWMLTFADNKVTVQANVRGVGKILPGRLYLFDFGIVLKHIELALEQEGKAVKSLSFDGEAKGFTAKIIFG